MDLQKYKNHLFQNIKNKLSEWLFLDEGETDFKRGSISISALY